MANYRPIAAQVALTANDSGTLVAKNLSQGPWGLALLQGTALFSGNPVPSAAVNVWESNTASGAPDHITFTNSAGEYGVTVLANQPLVIKVYGQ